MERSNEQFDYIGKAMDLCAGVPTPISMGDHMTNLISTQFFRGHQFGLAQAKRLYEEVKERVDQGLVACENEKIRLMYTGVPNWFTPGFYNAFEEKYGAVFAWMGYLTVVPKQLIRRDLRDPLRSVYARYLHYAESTLPPWWPEIMVYEAKKFQN
jgi:benzoyl-CoA reductase/2-hydroxyglutaryl-CoA dehydratase subunit BcrC/BadD/HgdB